LANNALELLTHLLVSFRSSRKIVKVEGGFDIDEEHAELDLPVSDDESGGEVDRTGNSLGWRRRATNVVVSH
jgi:hypothetical protein